MTRSDILRILDAHDAVWDAWWPALVRLRRSDAHRKVGGSFPTVFATTQHMVAAELYWHGRMDPRVDEGPAQRARSVQRLEQVWRELRLIRLAWLANSDLRRRVDFDTMSGDVASVAAWECLIHVVTHAHFHRGQLVSQFRAIGLPPPSRHLLGRFFAEY